jgi:hypothetical protein
MPNDKMTQTSTLNGQLVRRSFGEDQCFGHLNIFMFVIVSNFVLNISNFCDNHKVAAVSN